MSIVFISIEVFGSVEVYIFVEFSDVEFTKLDARVGLDLFNEESRRKLLNLYVRLCPERRKPCEINVGSEVVSKDDEFDSLMKRVEDIMLSTPFTLYG